jgi:hypothetical protein
MGLVSLSVPSEMGKLMLADGEMLILLPSTSRPEDTTRKCTRDELSRSCSVPGQASWEHVNSRIAVPNLAQIICLHAETWQPLKSVTSVGDSIRSYPRTELCND